MKNRILFFSVFALLLCGLVSCKNFLAGGEIKEELEDQISYAKAKKITVKAKLDTNDFGSLYPTEFTGVVGQAFTIEFTKKEDVVFSGKWLCLESSGVSS